MDKKESSSNSNTIQDFKASSHNVKPIQSQNKNDEQSTQKNISKSVFFDDKNTNLPRNRRKKSDLPFNKEMSFGGGKDQADIEEDNKAQEDDLLDIVTIMKDYSNGFVESQTEDNKTLNKISEKQDQNKNETDKRHKDLEEFQKVSLSLSWWRLLIMAITSIAIFVVTVSFITMDSLI